jgi:hypothetical protein
MKKFVAVFTLASSFFLPAALEAKAFPATGSPTECAQRRNDVTVARRALEVAESNVRIAKASLQRLRTSQSRADGRFYVAQKADQHATMVKTRSEGYEATAQTKVDAAQANLDTALAQSNVRVTTAARQALAKAQAALTAATKVTASATQRAAQAASRLTSTEAASTAAAAAVADASAAWQATHTALPGAREALSSARAAEKVTCTQVRQR